VKFQDLVEWINLLFVLESQINLLDRYLMSGLGIEIKAREKNFKISLNLMTVQIKVQILSEI
jgi:hypothetical protein